ncbi:MAG: hypothetical protein LKI53_02520 [Bacteroidales bacterium]|jgi:glycerophosphoryl diester phosphodiesterase|nr:hypothetical protein [Bacteroidales bacterium]
MACDNFFAVKPYISTPETVSLGKVLYSDSSYCLSNYRISTNKKGVFVGRLICPASGNHKSKFRIKKDTSNLFTMDKRGYLFLKKNKSVTPQTPGFRYGIEIRTSDTTLCFELVKDEFIHNKVIAHRGAWKHFSGSQNSISSLKNAMKIGAEGSEFDVWLSADGVPVISHDPSIKDHFMEKETVTELTKVPLDCGDYIPTLEEYLNVVKKQNHTQLILEIKSSLISQKRTLELTRKIVSLVHKIKAQAWVDYISFNYGALEYVKKLDPQAKTAYLADDKPLNVLALDGIDGIDYPNYINKVSLTRYKSAVYNTTKIVC